MEIYLCKITWPWPSCARPCTDWCRTGDRVQMKGGVWHWTDPPTRSRTSTTWTATATSDTADATATNTADTHSTTTTTTAITPTRLKWGARGTGETLSTCCCASNGHSSSRWWCCGGRTKDTARERGGCRASQVGSNRTRSDSPVETRLKDGKRMRDKSIESKAELPRRTWSGHHCLQSTRQPQ